MKRENAVNAEGATEAGDEDTVDGSILETKDDFFTAIESANESPDSVPGILAKVKVDTEHWLNAGVSEHVYGMVTGSDIFSPIKLTDGSNLAWYAEQQELLASGYLWKENLKQLAFKPFMVHQSMGRGMVIGFTQDIAVRAYLEGLYPLLANAILRAPAQSGKLR